MESSDIEWCPDDISGDNTDIVVFNENNAKRFTESGKLNSNASNCELATD